MTKILVQLLSTTSYTKNQCWTYTVCHTILSLQFPFPDTSKLWEYILSVSKVRRYVY